MRQTVRLTESELHNLIKNTVKRVVMETRRRNGKKSLREDFEQDYNNARNNYDRPLWGFEMKDSNNEWQYGDIQYDPKSQTMSCMGVTIDVDPDMTVDQNLEGLYEELMNQGYHDGDDEDEM